MVITTTPTIEGQNITDYLGIVTGEAIIGVNIFKDVFAIVRDVVGGRSAAYERELNHARQIAIEEIADHAKRLGADAIVSVDLDYEVLGQSMLMVSVSGTAVKLK